MITLGCLIAGIHSISLNINLYCGFFSGYGDLAFDPKAYMYGICSVFTQALYLVLVQKHASDQSAAETLHLNSYNTLPMLFLCSLTLGEFSEAVQNFQVLNVGFVVTFSVVISVGCLLNYLLFLCTQYNSALTTSITGTVKTIVQTIIGFFTFGGMAVNLFTIAGITINLSGGVLYTYTKYRAAKLHKKNITMETKVDEGDSLQRNGIVVVNMGLDLPNGKLSLSKGLAQPHVIKHN
jgi:solute carrier family 35 protein